MIRKHEAGQRDSAALHYRRVLHTWRAADPQFHPRRDSIAARLAALGSGSLHPLPSRGHAVH